MDKILDDVFNKRFTFRRDVSWTFSSLADLTTETEWNDVTLMTYKEELNNVKSLLNVMEPGEWRRHTTNMSVAGRVIPHLQKLIQPELLTQAWCKFWEIINSYELIKSDVLTVDDEYCSVHLCEAPGAFITAMNHYMKQNHESLRWNWIASTLNPYYEGNSTGSAILDDRFIFHSLDHWHFGSTNTGDIFDHKFVLDLQTTIGNRKVHLVTADGSIDCQDIPAEQESVVSKLFLAETCTALHLLTEHGSFVIKMFTFFEAQTISLLYMLNICFTKVHIFKPDTSKPGNSEVYVICLNYIGSKLADRVIRIMESGISKKCLALKIDSIPQTFFDQSKYCADLFKKSQIETIRMNLKAFEGMSEDSERELKILKQCCAEKFVKLYNLKPIDDAHKIAPDMSKDGETMLFEYSQKSGNLSFTERQALRNSWQRRLGSFRALARDLFRNADQCNVLNNTDTIVDTISGLVPGQVTLGSEVPKVHSSLFCPVQLLTAWNELDERLQKSGLSFSHDEHAHWSEIILSEIKELSNVEYNQKIFVSSRMTILSPGIIKQKLESVPIELQEETGGRNKSLSETTIEFQKMLIRSCLKWLHLSSVGDTVLLRLQSVHTRFTGGVLFMLASLFKKVSIVPPPQNNPLDAHTWCFYDFCPNQNLRIIFDHFCRILDFLSKSETGNKVVLETVPLDMLCAQPFYKFIVSRSTSVLLNKVWFLTKKLQF